MYVCMYVCTYVCNVQETEAATAGPGGGSKSKSGGGGPPGWIVMDGDLDGSWAEAMSSLLDDNRQDTYLPMNL